MTRLLDYIFYNLEERDLDRSQIEDYIRYLDELLLFQGLPLEKEEAYYAIKLQLQARLQKLNSPPIQFSWPNKTASDN